MKQQTHELRDVRINDSVLEVRTLEDSNKQVIRGYALKFNRPSEDMGFTEYLNERCLDNADMSNVVALLNHDSNYVLGRSGRNLKLEVDKTGLFFEIEPNDTSYARDLMENMRVGIIDKCSFAFSIAKNGDEWVEEENGRYVRTINKIDRLFDVSIVTSPAYDDTEAMLSQRSIDELNKQMNVPKEIREREIEIMDMDLELS